MIYFALRSDLFFYNESSSRNELKSKLEKMGFKYHEPQMGGGGETQIREITIGFFTIKELWAGIFLGVLGNAIYDLIKKLYQWHASKKVEKTNNIPNVFITVYPNPFKKKSFSFFVRIDRSPSKEEITEIIKEAKNKI